MVFKKMDRNLANILEVQECFSGTPNSPSEGIRLDFIARSPARGGDRARSQ